MTTEFRKTIRQALIGMFVVFASFVAGTIVCEFFIPGTMNRYLTPYGEWLVGMFIFFVSLTLWSIIRWKTAALFLTSGLTAILNVLLFLFYPEGVQKLNNMFSYVNWAMFQDLILGLRHTAFPVLCAALCLFALRSGKVHHRVNNTAGIVK